MFINKNLKLCNLKQKAVVLRPATAATVPNDKKDMTNIPKEATQPALVTVHTIITTIETITITIVAIPEKRIQN